MTTCRLRSPRSRSSPHTSYSQGKRPGERAIRARSIAILGWYGDFNAGNEAILSGILLSLRGVMPHGDFAVFSWHPELTARQHRVRAFPYYKLFQVLPRVDALIVGGGTLLTDWQLALPLFSLLVLAVGWAKMLGKPVIFYAVGAEPFSTRLGRILARAIINRADLVTVRGYRSKRFLEMLGTAKPIH
ncbi:MAG: polysaccharide pyruvyl transferase family protein, partial [Candidatus Bathyarchaeia archaeon]